MTDIVYTQPVAPERTATQYTDVDILVHLDAMLFEPRPRLNLDMVPRFPATFRRCPHVQSASYIAPRHVIQEYQGCVHREEGLQTRAFWGPKVPIVARQNSRTNVLRTTAVVAVAPRRCVPAIPIVDDGGYVRNGVGLQRRRERSTLPVSLPGFLQVQNEV